MSGKLPATAEINFDLDNLQIEDSKNKSSKFKSSRPSKNSSKQHNTTRSHNSPRPSSSKPPPPKIVSIINSNKPRFNQSQDFIAHFNFILNELEALYPNFDTKHETQFKNAVTDNNLNPVDHSKKNQNKIPIPEYLSELMRLISQKASSKYGGKDLSESDKVEIKDAVFGFVRMLRTFDKIFGLNCVDVLKGVKN